jgi:flagellum-specific peptidoglycan hydrolase FlgJ/LysM repeat protein
MQERKLSGVGRTLDHIGSLFTRGHNDKNRFVGGLVVASLAVGGGLLVSSAPDKDSHETSQDDKARNYEQLDSIARCDIDPETTVVKVTKDASGKVATLELEHRVQPKETLSSIAGCYFDESLGQAGVESLQQANRITDPNVIHPGDELTVYVTAPETVTSMLDRDAQSIADISGFSAETITTINSDVINEEAIIVPGKPIVLPRQAGIITGLQVAVVAPGDTYYKIAKAHNANVALTQSINFTEAGELRPGYIVLVPAPEDITNVTDSGGEIITPEKKLLNFVDEYGKYADEVQKRYGVPRDLVLAQAILESGYGEKELAVKANNFHGLKANDNWQGNTYTKVTEEYIDPEETDQFDIVEIINPDVDGKIHAKVNAKFRKYSSVEEGFLNYGDKLKNEGNYDDAFDSEDPYRFLDKMLDNKGAKYATDPAYGVNVKRLVKAIQDLDNAPVAPENATSDVDPSIAEKINAVDLTVEGYNKFVENIDKSYMPVAAEYSSFVPEKNHTDQDPTEMLIWHYTVSEYRDPKHFIGSIYNTGVNYGYDLAVQFFIGRDGQLYQLTDMSAKVNHIMSFSNISTGVEIEAKNQADVTTKQYETAAYWAVYNLIKQGLIDDKTLANLPDLVGGHYDMRVHYGKDGINGDDHTDFPPEESASLRGKVAELMKEMGYE